MKRFLSGLLLAAFCLSILAVPALAETAQLASTQDFIDALDEEDFEYTLIGIDEDSGSELVRVPFADYSIICIFDPDEDYSAFGVFNLIDFDAANRDAVLSACNKLNYDYKYVKFYVDDSDNSVTAYIDLAYGTHDRGEILLELFTALYKIADYGYEEQLGQYDTTA